MIDVATFANQVIMPAPTINTQSIFPELRIVPIDKLVPHEQYDTARADALQKRLTSDGVLQNPPIVVPLQGGNGIFMVLDGANRTNALKRMRVPHILVQVASPGGTGFELSVWNQVVLGISSQKLLSILESIEGLSLQEVHNLGSGSGGFGSSILIQIHLASHAIYNVLTPSFDLQVRIKLINIILTRIRQYGRLDRTHLEDIDVLTDLHTDMAGMIVFPCFEFGEIVQLAEGGQLIPAGITRFSISPRALRLNFKISDLRSTRSLVEKNEMMLKWVQGRVSQKGVRVYSETTILFDE